MTSGYYYKPREAAVELKRRRSLRQRVVEYWEGNGVSFPEVLLRDDPLAALGRHIATFRFEDAAFVWLAEHAGLRPAWLTYKNDKFVTRSPVKVSLLHPSMTSRISSSGGYHVRTVKLANQGQWINRPLSEVMTNCGQTLMDFHGARLLGACPEALVSDTSYACAGWGGQASRYYFAYLSMFVAHAVLFEDYHGGESGAVLGGFTNTVFEPAFQAVTEHFGVKPIVVPLPWWKELGYHPDGDLLADWRNERVFVNSLTERIAA